MNGVRASAARTAVLVAAAFALAACSSHAATPVATRTPTPSPSVAPTVSRPADPFPSQAVRLPAVDKGLPFTPASGAAVRGRLVFAHYLPFFTVSIDNQPWRTDYYSRSFLAVDGENGKHAAYGGFLRDRPLPRSPRASTSWQLLDLEDEVRRASAAGIDGFSLDLLEVPGDGDLRVLSVQSQLLTAAHAVDRSFRVMLMPDMAGGMQNKPMDAVAAYVAQLGRQPAAFHLTDGRLVVSPFNAESHSAAWWKQFIDLMRTTYGTSVALVPLFQDETKWAKSFAPISYGMSNWGGRSPAVNPVDRSVGTPIFRAEQVRARGKLWMQTVSVQDERPYQAMYSEADNTQNLRNTWQIARDSGSEWVQVATWNDYAEGTAISPSMHHGRAYLDLVSYYATWFKTGVEPPVARDMVYLTHRTQPYSARPTYPETSLMQITAGSPASDLVEALTFLTAPATVTVTVGGETTTCDLPAGVNACDAPLRAGRVSVHVTRGATNVASVTSPFVVTLRPRVQDLQYIAVSSGRSRA